MIKTYVIATAIALFFAGCAYTTEEKEKKDLFITTEYTCENENGLEVIYLTTGENGHHARIQFEKTLYILKGVPSGSGAKYSDGKHTWWTKGLSGFLEIDNVTILQNCLSQEKTDTNR